LLMAKKKGLSVLLVAKQNKAGLKAAKQAEALLKKYTDDIHVDRSTAFHFRRPGTSIRKFSGEFIITLGGDGTFLMTAHRASVPILPVRIEGKGFLCMADWNEFKKYMPDLFRKKFITIDRMRIRPSKIASDGVISKYIDKLHHFRQLGRLLPKGLLLSRRNPTALFPGGNFLQSPIQHLAVIDKGDRLSHSR